MKQISIEVAQTLPILDQLKILKALANVLSELEKGIRSFAYYNDGIRIEEITAGEYTVSLDGPIPAKTRRDLTNIFPNLSDQIIEQYPELPYEYTLNAFNLCDISNTTATVVIESCETLIKILSNEKQKASIDFPSENETDLGLLLKSLNKLIEKNETLFIEIPSINNHKKEKNEKRSSNYIVNKKNIQQEGGFANFIPGTEEIKINKKNGKITSIAQPNIKTNFDKEGRKVSIIENGIKTSFDQNGVPLIITILGEIDPLKIAKDAQIKQSIKLYKKINHAGQSVSENHKKNEKETYLFILINGGKGSYLKINDNDYYGASIIKRIEGDTLYDYLNKHSAVISETELCKLFLATLEELERIHQMGYIHADIKLENIIVSKDENGNFKITFIDFGMTKKREKTRKTPCGTPLFMPREVFERTSKSYLEQHDYYSLATSFLYGCEKSKISHSLLGSNQAIFNTCVRTCLFFMPAFLAYKPNTSDETPLSELLCEKPSQLNASTTLTGLKKQLIDTIEKNKAKTLSSSESKYDNNYVLFENDKIVNKRIEELKAEVAQKTVIGAPPSPNSSN